MDSTHNEFVTCVGSKRFRDISIVGEGAYGSVLEAYDFSLKTKVAIKKFKPPHATCSTEFSTSALREISV
jgi:serine/threonine protein kinase